MSVIRVRGTLIGEQVEYRYVRTHFWQPECGCILASITDSKVIIHHRHSGRIWRIPRPLLHELEAVCRCGHEHRLSEDQARMIVAGRVA